MNRSALQIIAYLLSNEVFDSPVVFEQAAAAHEWKPILPISVMSSKAQEQLGKDIFQRALVSSQVHEGQILDSIKDGITGILRGVNNPSQVRVDINRVLNQFGYVAPEGRAGTIGDLRTIQRQNIIIDTNLATARGFGRAQIANDPDLLDEFPAMELIRGGWREHPRGDAWYKEGTDGSIDWGERWVDAAQESGDDDAARVFASTGRMVALKSSPIWQALGDGAGGRKDALGNPYEPFAFNSAMVREEVARDDAVTLELIGPDDKADPAKVPEFNDSFIMQSGIKDKEILQKVTGLLAGKATIKSDAWQLT